MVCQNQAPTKTRRTIGFEGINSMNKISRAVLGAALLAISGLAAATATDFTVYAEGNSVAGGSALDTGITLNGGESLTITASGTWQNDPNAAYVSGPDGHSNSPYTDATSQQTFDIGALVGKIGSGDYFLIGSDFTGTANASGVLDLVYWDSDAYNNSGSVTAAVSAVPEPANLALMGLALGAFALTRRRKA
jgi:hypothetical protein